MSKSQKTVKHGSKTVKAKVPSNKIVRKKNDIRQISFKDINDDYSWGKYGDFKVIIMNENGYINATKICHDARTKNGKRKEFRHWKESTNANLILEEISGAVGAPTAQLLIPIITSKENLTIIRGTYAHPDLIPHIASWASPSFAVRVSKIINRYFIKKAIKAKEKIIKKKDDKIDELSNKIDELLHNNDTLLSKNKKMDNRIKRLLKKNDEIYEINEDISSKIDVISNDRVVSTGRERDEHMLVIIKNNDDPEEYDEADILYEYHTLRVMKKSYRQRLISHMERHPDMVIIKKNILLPQFNESMDPN